MRFLIRWKRSLSRCSSNGTFSIYLEIPNCFIFYCHRCAYFCNDTDDTTIDFCKMPINILCINTRDKRMVHFTVPSPRYHDREYNLNDRTGRLILFRLVDIARDQWNNRVSVFAGELAFRSLLRERVFHTRHS